MTLVVLWKANGQFMCAADTRITSGPRQRITEHGGKIAVVPIRWDVVDSAMVPRETRNYSLGFAFCGSTLSAGNTHAIASTCAQILHTAMPNAPPSTDLIAQIYARAGEQVMIDSRFWNPNINAIFECFLFGYCLSKKSFRAHLIYPKIEGGVLSVNIENFDVKDGDVLAIGSGASEFKRALEIRNSAGNERPIMHVIQEIMESGELQDVGGYPQIAIADETGARLWPVLIRNPENPDGALLTINGFDTSKVSNNEGFSFGLKAFSVGSTEVLARNALRAKGIDPDAGQVSKEFQNLASFEASIQYIFAKNLSKLSVTDNYILAPVVPERGVWYFFGRCECGSDVPYVIDKSNGKYGNIFTGNGRIGAVCFHCGKIAVSRPDQIVPMPFMK